MKVIMRNISFIICLIAFCFYKANAQTNLALTFGVHGEQFEERNDSSVQYSEIVQEEAEEPLLGAKGIQLGVLGAASLSKLLSIKTNIIYSFQKSRPVYDFGFINQSKKYAYSSIKVSLSLEGNWNRLSLGVGPSLSKYINRKWEYEDRGWQSKSNESSLGYLVSLNYSHKHFLVYGNYRFEKCFKPNFSCSAGLKDIKSFEIGLGYLFSILKE